MNQTGSKLKVDAIRELLLERIESGVYPRGECLPTESELAVELAVSRGTVSKALASLVHLGIVERRPRVGTKVVERTDEPTSVKPNLNAFAFIYPGEHHPGIWQIVSGFNEAAQSAGCRTLLLSVGSDFEKEAQILNHASDFNVRAVAVYPLIVNIDQRHQIEKALLKCPCPVVLTENSLPGVNIPAVIGDAFDAAYTMTRYLVKKGCKSIGFISNDSLSINIRDRYMGYKKAMQDSGLALHQANILQVPEIKPDFDHPLDGVRRLACRWFDQLDSMPDGCLCADDFIGLGCLDVAKQRGVKVPESIKIVGIGGYLPKNEHKNSLKLTTYKLPFSEIGKTTFQIIHDLVYNQASDENIIYLKGKFASGDTA